MILSPFLFTSERPLPSRPERGDRREFLKAEGSVYEEITSYFMISTRRELRGLGGFSPWSIGRFAFWARSRKGMWGLSLSFFLFLSLFIHTVVVLLGQESPPFSRKWDRNVAFQMMVKRR